MRYRGARASRWPFLMLVLVVLIAAAAIAYYLNSVPH
jgi:hypothetical protein